MKLMLVEPNATGHRMVLYTRHIAREARSRGWDVSLLTTRSATMHPAFEIVEAENRGALRVFTMPEVGVARSAKAGALLRQQLRAFQAVATGYARAVSVVQPDMVYVVNLDYFDKIMALLGSPFGLTPFAGMLMAIGFHRRRVGIIGPHTRNDRLYEWAFRRILAIRNLRAMTIIDPVFMQYSSSLGPRERARIHYVPDAGAFHKNGESRKQAREALGVGDDTTLVLLYGSITARKGLDVLLEAVCRPAVPPNVAVLVAGNQDDGARQALLGKAATTLRAQGRLIEIAGFLDDAEECRVFAAADIAWLNYRRFYGMSGFLLQAGAKSIPVVACQEGLIGWLTSSTEMGEVVPSGDVQAAADAIARLSTDAERRARMGASGKRVAEKHTPDAFASRVCDVLARSRVEAVEET